MDPNANLKRQHELAQTIVAKHNAMARAENHEQNSSWKITILGEAIELAELVLSNDCKRCESILDGLGYCTDETCPYSDHPQTDTRYEVPELES